MTLGVSIRQTPNIAIKKDISQKKGLAFANLALLEKINKLFACNIGEYINLPQLVVVGDQSSEKLGFRRLNKVKISSKQFS